MAGRLAFHIRAPEPLGEASACEPAVATPRTETTATMTPRPTIGRIAGRTDTWGRSPRCGITEAAPRVGVGSRHSNEPDFGVDSEPCPTDHHAAVASGYSNPSGLTMPRTAWITPSSTLRASIMCRISPAVVGPRPNPAPVVQSLLAIERVARLTKPGLSILAGTSRDRSGRWHRAATRNGRPKRHFSPAPLSPTLPAMLRVGAA